MSPVSLHLRVVRKIERLIHEAWAAWCGKFGPKLKITTNPPPACNRNVIRAASQTKWVETLESAFYCDTKNHIIVRHPEVSICNLKEVSIIGRESFLFTAPHELLRLDSSMDNSPIKKIRRPIGFISRRIEGPVVSLGSRYTDNHYHFLFEHLPLILLAREFIGTASELNILITPGQSCWQTEYLAKLGEQPKKIIELSYGTLQCEDAWVIPNHPLTERSLPFESKVYQEIVRLLKIGVNPKRRNRSIFITRKDASRRRLKNEDEIFSLLQQTHPNLERIALSRISLHEQITLFTEACFIIGPAGQAFRNVLFCEGALCVELVPGHRTSGNIYHEWISTTTHLALTHGNRYLPLSADEDYQQDESDWTFPLDKIRSSMDRLHKLGESGV
ncbi:MAG: glycosyltransferase family 61 protein [Opitutus sp.]|nr:glycosyltransferase family 61 protein [Opitutus sp.]MCS6247762.1 glycosyltransferase family 61 protein [Opitutus sp.]MCS6274242.1 glycosyltransferase family 61 protein [Opitutus sp.]MCS6278005.1 glycosyltransferase family 61 protein [Opitutus sp.]MCS6298887.1 glycosyltransferase family 61 protein [Opitutus sp.]